MSHPIPIAHRWSAAFLAACFLISAPRDSRGQATPDDFPEIQVLLEGVDTTDYPRIKIRFRVFDTNPETKFKTLDRPDVKIVVHEALPTDSYSGPGIKPVPPPDGNNFKDPDVNELATSFCVDRSASIESVISQIGRAIDTYAGKLKVDHLGKPLKQSGPEDIMNVIIFSGANDAGVLSTNYTANAQAVEAFTATNFVPGGPNGTPYYNALESALGGIERQQYLKRAVIVISDGRQAVAPLPDLDLYKVNPDGDHMTALDIAMMGRVEHLVPPKGVVGVPGGLQALQEGNRYLATRLGERMATLKVPMFALGFSRIEINKQTGQFSRVRILEEALRPLITKQIGGAFFRPRSPLPEIPDFPGKKAANADGSDPSYTDAELNDPGTLDDAPAKAWVLDALSLIKNEAAAAGGKSGPLPSGLEFLAKLCLFNSDGTYPDLAQDFEDGLPELDKINLLTRGNLRAAYNDLVNQVFWKAVERMEGDTGVLNTVYYRELSDNLFDKIRYSLKNTFYILYDSPSNDEEGPEERKLRLTVSYVSPYKGRDELLSGSAEAPFKKPLTIPEDSIKPIDIPLEGNQPALNGMVRSTNPRGGAWNEDKPTLKYKIALWAEVDRPGDTPVKVQLAEKTPDGAIQLKPQENLDPEDKEQVAFNQVMGNGGTADQNLLRLEMTTYLESATFYDEEVDTTDPDKPRVTFKARVPTPSLSPAGQIMVARPTGAPLPKINKLWYFFIGKLERTYEFEGTQTATFDLPSVKFFISDRTMPNVSVRFETDAAPLMPEDSDTDGVSHIWCREIPVDKEKDESGGGAEYEYRIRGPNFVPDVDIQDQLLKVPPAVTGITLKDPEQTIPGYFVKENTRLRIQVLAKDNFIWNYDHLYLSNRDSDGVENPDPDPAKAIQPFSNRWDDKDFGDASSTGYDPPFLGRADWGNVQADTPTGGVTWRLVQDGEVIEEVPDTFTFRAPNYDPPNIGKPYELQIKASDGNPGNLNSYTIPIWVVPQDFNIDVIRREIKVELSNYKDNRGEGL